jgi:glycerate 2-kinase
MAVPERPVLVAPDKFKGTYRASEVAAAIGRGLERAGLMPPDLCPVADGGEGTQDALVTALGGEIVAAEVRDPIGRPVRASYALLEDGSTGLVEMAAASGLALLTTEERDPDVATTYGTGELICAAVDAGASVVLVAVGGSATVDGGAGLREVVRELSVPTVALCDVRTRLADAARLFGPQKGASPQGVVLLERRLAEMRELEPFAELPGAGAAGGLGAAFAALGAELVAGAPAVLDLVGFDTRLAAADVVVTGEGRVDVTTAEGKAPGEVARRALAAGKRCVVFGGVVELEVDGVETVALSGDPARAESDLAELGARLASEPGR